MIEGIESKLIFAFLINDYSLHIFVYEQAQLSSISLKCTKVNLSIPSKKLWLFIQINCIIYCLLI